MKQRFSSLDIKVIAHELSNSLVSLRVSNVYDLSSRIFLIKFAKPDHREQLIIESGFRCHLTSFARATAASPSAFVTRLRKFLRTRRVTSVSQVGTDRIIEIQFSDGAYRMFLEFYAGGNIVLTDNELTIIALLRSVTDSAEEHERYRLGLTYNLSLRQNYAGTPPVTRDRVREGLQKAVDRGDAEAAQGKKMKRKAGGSLRKVLASTNSAFPPVLLDHAMQVTGFETDTQPADVLKNESLMDKLMTVFEEAGKVLTEITSAESAKGYILAKRKDNASKPNDASTGGEPSQEDEKQGLLYDEYHPFRPAQMIKPDVSLLEFAGFNHTVDEFYSSIEGQKLESRLQEREDHAKRKLEQARQDHEKRIGGLQQVQETNVLKAQAIEANLDRVEEAIAAVNGLIAQGMDWVEIGRLIGMEQSRHNPVAELIKLPLKLERNTATLLLAGYDEQEEEEMADLTDSEPSDSEDEGEQSKKPTPTPAQDKRLSVDVDLALSAWSNARQYYDQRKAAATKQDKTQQASQKALKSTEQKITADLRKGLKQEKQLLHPVRKQMWFEKFIYFISSDGYLVLGGKDAQQAEMLYRRYLKKGDVYVHADLPGAVSVMIKNQPGTPEAPIPPSTLSQAGNLSVCTSNAWDSKAVMSAWWVNAEQVSKTAPTGEYLTAGGFTIQGKKNFLPPAQLLLGFAVAFQITEESKARHVKHRFNAETSEKPTESTDTTTADELAAGDDDDFDAGPVNAANKTEDDEDDEFPDANQEDSDDDFPDANDDGSDRDTDAGGEQSPSNPLQPTGQARDAKHDDEEDDSSGDEAESVVDHSDHQAAPATDDEQVESTDPSGVRHLSAKERRQRKKGGAGDVGDAAESSAQSQSAGSAKQDFAATKTTKTQPAVRGKRGKAKKAANKYADQDEEDRRIAMQLLGSRGGADQQKDDASDDAAAKAKESAEAARARRRAQHEKAQREGLEAEQLRRLNMEDNAANADNNDDDAEDSAAAIPLDTIVGTPLPGDEILEAIPICAPWNALGRYKYKAKLQPGAQKKGKAVREILGRWIKASAEPRAVDEKAEDVEKIWPREAELVKAWKEAEVVGIIPVKSVRVMLSGGSGGAGGGGQKGRGAKGKRGGRGSKKSK